MLNVFFKEEKSSSRGELHIAVLLFSYRWGVNNERVEGIEQRLNVVLRRCDHQVVDRGQQKLKARNLEMLVDVMLQTPSVDLKLPMEHVLLPRVRVPARLARLDCAGAAPQLRVDLSRVKGHVKPPILINRIEANSKNLARLAEDLKSRMSQS